MGVKNIDILNIFLIIISLIIAIKIPFELFLFSYSVLGPLHYLTEISWLRKKKYFISSNKNWSLIFIILTIIISIHPIIRFSSLEINNSLNAFIKFISNQTSTFILIGFLFAVGLTFFKKLGNLILILILLTFISFTFKIYLPNLFIFIGIFLPTLIHVYIFTLLFIIYGALKAKSNYGFYLSIILLIVPFIIFNIPIDYLNYNPSNQTVENFRSSNFINLNAFIAKLLNELPNGRFHPLSEIGLRIQIFISFAYTYHYLNWFSKTSIIGWKNSISKKSAFSILLVWIGSISLYIYDFKTGFISLFLLSFLHVFLEFPLNIITIREILLSTKSKLH
jgi:hypothetical protein